MSGIADITVYDGASTPAAHVLKAIDVTRENGVVTANWREHASGVPVYAQVRASAKLQRNKTGVWITQLRVVVPVMESVSGQNAAGYTAAPKVAFENSVVVTGYFHERGDDASRRLVRQLALNLMGDISTSVTPDTSGAMPDLFDALISPT